ncbi:MAG: PQQ-dependent sugar dehydrogenase [Leptospiraceae bacterium]|nr:PQQ-dependent sugar dehydrogenase [Leptospiraceae bacterium]
MQPFPMVYPRLGRLFAVVEKRGLVYLVSQNSGEKVVLLDEIEKTLSQGWEEGMLSLAFSPDFAKSGRMYIYSSRANPRRTVLSRYSTVLPSLTDKIISLRDLKLKWQEEVLLEIRQPFSNHNGGTILFGPDGMLYLGTGDGGSAGDPRGYAQNPASLLGKILRLKVDGPQGYEIPPDNPFVKKTNYRGEIFALGLRNPWRMSFSPEGELIVADVGQDLYEEVTIVKAGENHGWNIMEGFHCFQPKTNCPKEGLVMPILEYTHEEGQSILGGEVYTGKKIPFLHGKYVFGDSMSGKIWYTNLKEKNPQKKLLITLPGLLSSFGRDQDGELYVIEMTEGKIYRLEPN